ncbi:MAG TPA: ATP-dependent DNA ligase [Albitalea sp.]
MASTSPTTPPIEPMLAKIADELPPEGGFLYEPKWDGFRALVFRNADGVHIQSRDLRPLNRYFPELERALAQTLPRGCVLDGEIVVVGAKGLDFDALQQRLHPAASRVAKLAQATPASFVAFDLLAAGGRSTMELPQAERRVRLERLLASIAPPVHVTPVTRDRAVAEDWLRRFEGAGLDGVIAKPDSLPYQPGKRAMYKIKHSRTADCVVAGFRWYRDQEEAVGSLLLGLFDDAGVDCASLATREAAGCSRCCSASKSSPLSPTTTISPSRTQPLGSVCASARSSSGK